MDQDDTQAAFGLHPTLVHAIYNIQHYSAKPNRNEPRWCKGHILAFTPPWYIYLYNIQRYSAKTTRKMNQDGAKATS